PRRWFFSNLNQGNAPIGLFNLAGSALLGNFQRQITRALGLSEFRIFPAPLIDPEERTTTFGLAGEAAVDLGDRLSLSVLKLLNPDRAAQYGVRYRISESTVLRGSTDFDDDSRGTIEFERRF
ncbi:MAG: hypothetical protein HC890_16960, partial [Chloroflexaceae bacterium]|nr:hypothetical protein [Chloroflexaceae bacterium]